MDEWMDRWMVGCMVEWMDRWMVGCMDEWMDRWMVGCMDGVLENISSPNHLSHAIEFNQINK